MTIKYYVWMHSNLNPHNNDDHYHVKTQVIKRVKGKVVSLICLVGEDAGEEVYEDLSAAEYPQQWIELTDFVPTPAQRDMMKEAGMTVGCTRI